jgi:hypothetical protein
MITQRMKINGLLKAATNDTNHSCHSWLLLPLSCRCRILMVFIVASLITHAGWAQRKNTFGTQIDISGGASNQIGGGNYGTSYLQMGMAPYYAVYPTLQLNSDGANSKFDASYTFGWERFHGDTILTTMSHVGNANFSASLSKSVRLQLTDSFYNAPEYSTINLFKGITLTPEGFHYVFDPALQKRSSFNNNASAALDVDVGAASSLSFRGSSSYRHYEADASFKGRLSDQLRTEGNFVYSRKLSAHHTWTIQYSAAENRYKDYGNTLTHHVGMGYSRDLSPSTRLSLEAGPSYVQSMKLQRNYTGYRASFSISHSIRSNNFTLSYHHSSGESTGMGSVSDIDNAGLGFSRSFKQRISLNVNLSAYRGKGRMDNPYDSLGYHGTAALSFMLNHHWTLSFGGSYRKIEGSTYLNSAYERMYVSLRFATPQSRRATR